MDQVNPLTAISELHALIDLRPAEPFRDRPRRPNGYRETPAYRTWEADTDCWHRQIADLIQTGLDLHQAEDRATLCWHGFPVPSTDFIRDACGAVKYADGRPTPPLPLPPAKQKLQTFLKENRKVTRDRRSWDLQTRFYLFLYSHSITVPSECKSLTLDRIRRLELQWLTGIRDMLDPQIRIRARQAAGPTLKLTLRHHHMAAAIGEALRSLQRTNPGAVAWYFGHPESETAESPGEIITAVRRQFADEGGRHWRILAAQPAADTGVLMQRYGPEGTAFIVNAMGTPPSAVCPPGRHRRRPFPYRPASSAPPSRRRQPNNRHRRPNRHATSSPRCP